MCFIKVQQYACLRRLIVPYTGSGIGIRPSNPEKLCRRTWESQYEVERCMRPTHGTVCGNVKEVITRRWFGLCSPCAEITHVLYQEYRRDIYRQRQVNLPADWEGWFALPVNVVHPSIPRPPFLFWIEVGRRDGGGLELVNFNNRWALCGVLSGDRFVGDEPDDVQCVHDFWDAETRDYTLTEEEYADEAQAAQEAEGEPEDNLDDDEGDEDEDDSNEPSMHGFHQHLGFEVDPGI